jgi:hypothetical protein
VIIIYRLFAPKSILETEKTLKTLSLLGKYIKKTHWAGFKKKPGFFPTLVEGGQELSGV